MRTQLHRDATAELEAAAEWYESEEEGLGEELLEEVSRGLAVIAEGPMIWPLVRRKGTLRRFVLPVRDHLRRRCRSSSSLRDRAPEASARVLATSQVSVRPIYVLWDGPNDALDFVARRGPIPDRDRRA